MTETTNMQAASAPSSNAESLRGENPRPAPVTTTDPELEAMEICYNACLALDERAFDRIYVWIGERKKWEREQKKKEEERKPEHAKA